MSLNSPFIRLEPLHVDHLPQHPSLSDDASARPRLDSFLTTLLDQGRALVLPTEFNLNFKSQGLKSSPPSNNEVEVFSKTFHAADIENLPWTSEALARPRPGKFRDEHWFARRSLHHNSPAPGTAEWEQFLYGLRDHHAKHEFDFTSSIYDARLICDWTDELQNTFANGLPSARYEGITYTHMTMAIYEMCHKLPTGMDPRCFPVLVVTASCSEREFIAVTVPVDISDSPVAFYSSGRNKKEGVDSQQRKSVTIGHYCAVERVHKYAKHRSTIADAAATTTPMSAEKVDEEIEWVMATSSHAKGSVPMKLQQMSVPGAIAKDVGLFLKWIHKIPRDQMAKQVVGVSTAHP